MIARIRRFWWRHLRRYRYEICQTCGRPASGSLGPDTYWFAANWLWNEVHGSENGILCAPCFTKAAAAKGRPVGWMAGGVGEIEGFAFSEPRRCVCGSGAGPQAVGVHDDDCGMRGVNDVGYRCPFACPECPRCSPEKTHVSDSDRKDPRA